MRKNNTKWVFANLRDDISTQVLAISETYKARFKNKKTKPHHINACHTELAKFFQFVYLSGSNVMEPVNNPSPKIVIINEEGKTRIEIEKMRNSYKGQREILKQKLPVFNESERDMWNYITDGGMETDGKAIFKFEEWNSVTEVNLNGLFKTNFRTALRDEEGKVHANYGITPTVLKYMRLFSVIKDYKTDPMLAMEWFGWKDPRVLYKIAAVRREIAVGSQVEALKRDNLLTGLRIDAGKALQGY